MTGEYNAGGIVYRRARLADDADLRATLRDNAMNSWVALTLEREPSFFEGEGLMGESVAVIARKETPPYSAVGMYSCAFLPVHVNGKPECVGYLGGLRVNRPYRRRPRIVKNGFASIHALVPNQGTVPFWFTTVGRENSRARRLLEASLVGMPVYRQVGVLETLAIATRQGRERGLLQRAVPKDIDGLADFYNLQAARHQFAPVLTEEWLRGLSNGKGLGLNDFWLVKDGPEIRGCLAVWDQRALKQTVARGYRFPLNALRRPYNVWASATGRVKLPAPGKALEQVYLAFVAFDERADDVAVDAVREGLIKARDKGAAAGVLGLAETNPLAGKLKAAFSAHSYHTCIETVSWHDDPEPKLDGRAPQQEVALL